MMDLLLLLLLIVMLVSALLCLEVEDTTLMLLLLVVFATALGLAFVYVGAVFAGIFQLIIYAGVMTVLFIATVYMVDDSTKHEGGVSS